MFDMFDNYVYTYIHTYVLLCLCIVWTGLPSGYPLGGLPADRVSAALGKGQMSVRVSPGNIRKEPNKETSK